MKKFFTAILLLSFAVSVTGQSISGELKRWHKVTLTFNGPNTSETANPNPFSDFNLEVTFTKGNQSYKVPGYFAACGNAENTGCNSGNRWRVHFAPGSTGDWNWSASFKKGSNVAINGGGTSGGFMDGTNGSFSIAESNKGGKDFRAKNKGKLQYVGEHYLRHSGTNDTNPNGPWFVKAGADSPENAFHYEDFDGTPGKLGDRLSKEWAPHRRDYVASDASAYTWGNGKGTELLGVLNYLSGQGANVMSFLTWNTGGDDGGVFPHILKGTMADYERANKNAQWGKMHKDRFDVSKLGQWEKIMEYADKKGVYLHFKTMETENDNFMDGNNFGRERKLYYRELIARFGHHLALNWNLTEETTLTNNVVKATASYIKNIDPYNSNIVVHTYPDQQDQRFNPLLGSNSVLTGASIQTSKNNVHRDVKKWIDKSRDAGRKWVVANDEQGNATEGIRIASDKSVRENVLWGSLMAGGTGVEYYSGYTNNDGDLHGQDHRKRGNKYKDGSYALEFFNKFLQPYMVAMVSADGVTGDTNDYVFAKAGEVYAVYRPNGGSTAINLSGANNSYKVQWYNPRAGGALSAATTAGANLVAPDTNNDWVALITKNGNVTPNPAPAPSPTTTNCVAVGRNNVIAVEAEHFASQSLSEKRKWYVLNKDKTSGPKPDKDPSHHTSASSGGYLEILPDNRTTHGDKLIVGENFSDEPGKLTIINYKVKFASAGKYFVWVRAYSTGTEDNGVHVGLNGQWPNSGKRMQWCDGKNAWTWESKQRTGANHCGEAQKIFLNVPSAGVHTVSFSLREDGFEMDKFVLTKEYKKPTGNGPAEILENCGSNPAPNPTPAPAPTPTPAPNPGGAAINIPGNFQAENFASKNGQLVIEETPNSSNKNLGYITNGNYIEFKASVANTAEYSFDFYASSNGEGGTLTILENGNKRGSLSIPKSGAWHNYKKYTTKVTLNQGTKNVRFVFNGGTGYLFNLDRIVAKANIAAVSKTVTLSPVQDAYLDGSTRINSDIVRVESGRRTGYLLFDLSKINGTITKADLKFTITEDPGDGELMVHQGTNSSWRETTLANSNKPGTSQILGSATGTFGINSSKNISLKADAITGNLLSLVLNAVSGNDFAFASKEHGSVNKPQLVVTYTATANKADKERVDLVLYPNPANDRITIQGIEKVQQISIYDMLGKTVKTFTNRNSVDQQEIDISNLPSGMYFVRALDFEAISQQIKFLKK